MLIFDTVSRNNIGNNMYFAIDIFCRNYTFVVVVELVCGDIIYRILFGLVDVLVACNCIVLVGVDNYVVSMNNCYTTIGESVRGYNLYFLIFAEWNNCAA